MADQLRLGVGDSVILMGSNFRISGIFDIDSFESFKDLDREQILPAYMESGQGEDLSEAEMEAVHLGAVIAAVFKLPVCGCGPYRRDSFRYLRANGGSIQFVSVMTGSTPLMLP